MSESKKSDDRKVAGASYILNFYRDVATLTDYYSQYINYMIEIEHKYPDVNKASEQELESIKNAVQNMRLYCMKVYIQYKSIALSLKLPKDEEIERLIIVIKAEYILSRENVETYVILMNNLLVKEIISQLIDNSDNLLREAFN